MSYSRRHFLKDGLVITAAGLLTRLPAKHLWAMTPTQLIPEPDEALLKELAQKAMDAARAGGATFADIRLTAARYVAVLCGYRKGDAPVMGTPTVGFPTRYGVRAIVDGAWGFASGTDIAEDAIVATARTAVAVARANKPRRARTLELAPAENVMNGTWATPIELEPLDVPIGNQAELGFAALDEAAKVPEVVGASVSFGWRRPVSILANTDSLLVTFRYATATPGGSVLVSLGDGPYDSGGADVEGLLRGPYGYEALNGTAIVSGMRPAAERAIAKVKAARNPVSVEVGRYDMVFSAQAAASILTTTIADAVNAERALGYWANRGGTSYAAPPVEILGKFQAASPLVSVRGDRTRSGGAATVAWDDEGVKPRDYTFIRNGVFTDYHTNRETAPQLAVWYRSQGQPVTAQGIARGCGSSRPSIVLPNLTMEPGPGTTTIDDMIKDVRKGLYVESAVGDTDQQLISNQYSASYWNARYIKNGKLGAHVRDLAFQFNTTPFWNSVDAIGGRGSAQTWTSVTDDNALFDPLQPFPFSTFEFVPMRVRRINVLNTGRTA